jgi:hypothetical protein
MGAVTEVEATQVEATQVEAMQAEAMEAEAMEAEAITRNTDKFKENRCHMHSSGSSAR